MNHRRNNFNFPEIAGAVLLSFISCSNPISGPEFPSPPPLPTGAITCVGHIYAQGEAMSPFITDFWYAYWIETPDSSLAKLETGLISNRIQGDTSRDTIYLERRNQIWQYAPNDPRASYWDTTEHGGIYVTETSDSLYFSFGFGEGSFTDYYLKKLK